MHVLRLGPGDDERVRQAAHLFDDPPEEEATRRFLEHPDHHLLVAYEEGTAAGFVSGVEVTHPDKGTEMFLYELGVDERFRRRGIGRALTEALGAVARERGCRGMFVLTQDTNEPALATYRAAGAVRDLGSWVMLEWRLTDT